MCGIVGVVHDDTSGANPAAVRRMLSVLRHRGPDDEGTYDSGPVSFGFRRLSILDLSPAGHQPMTSTDAMVTIVFNGEIYNFIELRRELEAKGHVFRSAGDTEVLLHSYLEWGPDCLKRLSGMWAFVIHDRRSRSLFGARDRFGIKPLYLHQRDGYLVFASEIKSIRASGCYVDRLDYAVAASFLVDGRLEETPATFFHGIRQLAPGRAFTFDVSTGEYLESSYWSIEQSAQPYVEDIPARFAELFEDAVRVHMRSDVPVGIHLSGGLDSTAIACASARIRRNAGAHGPLSVFSYIAPEFDESEYIRATVAQTGAQLTELKTSPQELWADLERMLWFQDEPVHSLTALVGFQLMRATAAQGIKVVLNGQGADETLAGYTNFFRHYWLGLLRNAGVRVTWKELSAYTRVHGRGTPAQLLAQLLKRRSFYSLWKQPWYRARAIDRRRARALHGWFSADLLKELPDTQPVAPPDLSGALAFSQSINPLPLYLRVEDRNSMAHSIEARLPFLDHQLAEFAYALPDNWKARGPWNKYVLREAMAGRIPENVRTRVDKMGFPVPSRQWFSTQLFEPVMDLLTSRRAVESGRYKIDVVRRDIGRHQRGEADFTDALFAVAQFELWFERVDQSDSTGAEHGRGSTPSRSAGSGGRGRRADAAVARVGLGGPSVGSPAQED
jgi:asparagine synthase (glutamine-hydrolysing)